MDRLDEFVNNLQEEIFNEAKAAYGEKGFERWRNPRLAGRMDRPDGMGRVTGTCGDTMEMYLKFKDNRVAEASYFTDGCASSNICGSFAAEMALGKDPDELAGVTGEDILKEIGSMPEKDLHCTRLAAETLQEALSDYMVRRRSGEALR